MSRFLHSHSGHEAHDACPAKFVLTQERAVAAPASDNLRFGQAFHRFAELYLNHCIEARRWSDRDVLQPLLNQAFTETGISTRYYEELFLLCDQFVRLYKVDPERSIAREGGVAFDDQLNEVPWSEQLEYGPEFRGSDSPAMFRTKHDEVLLDAVDRILYVTDFKTDRHIPSVSETQDPSHRWWKQASTGSWSAKRHFFPNATAVVFEFVFVRYTNPDGSFVRRELMFTPDALDEYERVFMAKIEAIETATEFPARPGEHCRMCSFLTTSCPVRELAHAQLENPEEIAAKFLHEGVLQEQRRAALKEITEKTGPIAIGGIEVGLFEESEKQVLDVALAYAALKKEGLEDPAYVLDVSATKLKNVLEKDQVERVLAAASTPERKVVFNVHQSKAALVELAKDLGIENPAKKTVAQLAQELANVMAHRAA